MPEIDPFAVVFKEAIAFLRRRLEISPEEWAEILKEAGEVADILAAGQKDAMSRDLLKAVQKVLEEGTGIREFREDYARITAEHGWSYDGDKRWHSRLVFDVQMRVATAAGRWEQIQRVKKQRPFLRYRAVMDNRTRPQHAAMHNVVLPVDHPWWKTHYPPNGFSCRCSVQSLDAHDLKSYGYKLTDFDHPVLNLPPDEGWEGNVGIAGLLLAAKSAAARNR